MSKKETMIAITPRNRRKHFLNPGFFNLMRARTDQMAKSQSSQEESCNLGSVKLKKIKRKIKKRSKNLSGNRSDKFNILRQGTARHIN